YMGIEVGVPTYILQYLPADTPEVLTEKKGIIEKFNAKEITSGEAALAYLATTEVVNVDSIRAKAIKEYKESAKVPNEAEEIAAADKAQKEFEKLLKDTEEKIATTKECKSPEITTESISKTASGYGLDESLVGTIVAVYWLMMLIGRFLGGAIGGKISSRTMITVVSLLTIVLVGFGMFATTSMVEIPGIDWAKFEMKWAEVPVGILAFLLVGLCTSVMWGGIFNMAVEGLGKYTAVASGIFMTMVFGCAVMLAIQGWVADVAVDYLTSYWVVIGCAVYLLFYALIGSKPAKVKE
ncbi:MAG: MFS transporter, partial [Muribaculaceae bacterium]|nr:MFS transporter [Muribaculaceae bacterium]